MRGDRDSRDDQPERDPEHPDPDHRSGPSARTLLIAALVMIGVGYFLTVKLRETARIQDCVMSGRSNCAPISGEKK